MSRGSRKRQRVSANRPFTENFAVTRVPADLVADWGRIDKRPRILHEISESTHPDPIFAEFWAAGIVLPLANPRAVRRLAETTRSYRVSKEYLDAKYRSRRRARPGAVRGWYLNELDPPPPQPQPAAETKQIAAPTPVIAIDGVTRCVLSHERLRTVWNDALDAWVYADPVVCVGNVVCLSNAL